MKKLSLKELNRVSVQEFKQQEKQPIALVLDNIRSALNVGSAFRTADAFALQHIYLCGITAQPPHREILKTAIGATASVDWSYFETTKEAIAALKSAHYLIAGVEQVDERTWLQDFEPDQGRAVAIVLGNEVNGLSDDILPMLDVCLEIPQQGTKHSLNVSVCLGIVVWEVASKLQKQKKR